MVRHAKVPASPPASLQRNASDVLTVQDVLWRIHRTQGPHVVAWNALRTFGPVATGRYDPHPLPPGASGEGVTYAAGDIATALAEVFQVTRVIDTASSAPQLTAWTPVRPLRLLNLTATWAVRNQASAQLNAAPRRTCQNWARAIRAAWPDLDGLRAVSTMTGSPTTVLWTPAATSFPALPGFSRPLSHPVIWALASRIGAQDLGYAIV